MVLFKLNKTLSEEDHFAFQVFQSLYSEYGKRWIRKRRISFIAYAVFILVFYVYIVGWTTYSIIYTTLIVLLTALYLLLLPKIVVRNIKSQMKQMKKTSKLPYERVSTMEFYEDKFVDIDAATRTEQSYSSIERVNIVKDQYIYLHYSNVSVYILPIAQVKAQLNYEEFVNFLSGKCANVHTFSPKSKA